MLLHCLWCWRKVLLLIRYTWFLYPWVKFFYSSVYTMIKSLRLSMPVETLLPFSVLLETATHFLGQSEEAVSWFKLILPNSITNMRCQCLHGELFPLFSLHCCHFAFVVVVIVYSVKLLILSFWKSKTQLVQVVLPLISKRIMEARNYISYVSFTLVTSTDWSSNKCLWFWASWSDNGNSWIWHLFFHLQLSKDFQVVQICALSWSF